MGANTSDTFQDVLDAEMLQIQSRRAAAEIDPAVCEVEKRLALTGVALSGGGVRSACVGLGLLQSLYRHGILSQIDYLSTVSGGDMLAATSPRTLHR